MTREEQAQADQKARELIAQLAVETSRLTAETAEINRTMKYRMRALAVAYFSALALILCFF